MSRFLVTIAASFLVLAVAGYGGWWLFTQREISLATSLPDRAAAIANAEQIVKLGSAPDKWPTRMFVPAGALRDLAAAVVGTRYRLPIGDLTAKGPDGFLFATVRKLEFAATETMLKPHARIRRDAERSAPLAGD